MRSYFHDAGDLDKVFNKIRGNAHATLLGAYISTGRDSKTDAGRPRVHVFGYVDTEEYRPFPFEYKYIDMTFEEYDAWEQYNWNRTDNIIVAQVTKRNYWTSAGIRTIVIYREDHLRTLPQPTFTIDADGLATVNIPEEFPDGKFRIQGPQEYEQKFYNSKQELMDDFTMTWLPGQIANWMMYGPGSSLYAYTVIPDPIVPGTYVADSNEPPTNLYANNDLQGQNIPSDYATSKFLGTADEVMKQIEEFSKEHPITGLYISDVFTPAGRTVFLGSAQSGSAG